MFFISAGTDIYGRVKKVSGTPVVTKFAMFQKLPIYPLQSFYFNRSVASETLWVPFVVDSRSEEIIGIPLASVDAVSVIVGYLRGIFGACSLLGFFWVLIAYISWLEGRGIPTDTETITLVLRNLLIIGVAGGVSTYVIPLTPRRERDIRQYCAELIGLSADPARVTSEMSSIIIDYAEKHRASEKDSRAQLIYQLVVTRAKMAQGISKREMESKTDELLARLKHA